MVAGSLIAPPTKSTAATRTRAASAASGPGSVGARRPRAQDLSERAGGEPDADVEGPEERVARARRVEAHLVNELLEDQGVVGEERDAPLPVVEADRARNHLRHLAGVPAPDLAMASHQLGARRRRQV